MPAAFGTSHLAAMWWFARADGCVRRPTSARGWEFHLGPKGQPARMRGTKKVKLMFRYGEFICHRCVPRKAGTTEKRPCPKFPRSNVEIVGEVVGRRRVCFGLTGSALPRLASDIFGPARRA
jgi:hypothetical protein